MLKKTYIELHQNQYEFKDQSWLHKIWLQILTAGIYIAIISLRITLSDL